MGNEARRKMELTMPYKIESGIPLPLRENNGHVPGELTVTLMKMNVGDSVFVPSDKKTAHSFDTTAKKHTGYRYAKRRVEGGYRIWRVE
jgi:hypothetical protein